MSASTSGQMPLMFTRNTIQQIRIYNQANHTESRTENGGVKLTPTQKEALQSICREHNISVSRFIADALDAYIEIFPFKDKIHRNRDLLMDLLGRLS